MSKMLERRVLGMVETGAFGTEAYIPISLFLILPKILGIDLNDGFDKRTGKQIRSENRDSYRLSDLGRIVCSLRHSNT